MLRFGSYPLNSIPKNSFPKYSIVGIEINNIVCTGITSVNGEFTIGYGFISTTSGPPQVTPTDSDYSYSDYSTRIKNKSKEIRKIKNYIGTGGGTFSGQSTVGVMYVNNYHVQNEELKRLIIILNEL
jgi:hypothetical protein